MDREQMTERIDGDMHLAALAPLEIIVSRTATTLWGTLPLHRATIQFHGTGIIGSSLGPPDQRRTSWVTVSKQPAAIRRCVCW